MAGLQGSGKTTTSGKLANWLKKGGHRPMLVSVDVYRPAARDQLKVVADAVKAPIYVGNLEKADTENVLRLAKEARREAVISGCDILIVDTAGRLHIDDQLMEEMQGLKSLLNPQEIMFVADSMTGQDAVKSADEFHKKLSLTGVVLTKMDGDARGGAALSIRHVTGQPIKFIGIGEKYDAIEPFHPDRIVSRILGMGDILSLIEKAEATVDKKKAEEFTKKALAGDGFSLEDFRDQLRQVKKMGSFQSILGMLPRIGPFANMQKMADHVDEKQINRVEAIINSMTSHERDHHEVINGSRRKRIARGSGTTVQEVNNLATPVRADEKDVQGHGQGQLRPQTRRNENARNVVVRLCGAVVVDCVARTFLSALCFFVTTSALCLCHHEPRSGEGSASAAVLRYFAASPSLCIIDIMIMPFLFAFMLKSNAGLVLPSNRLANEICANALTSSSGASLSNVIACPGSNL